VDLAAGEGHPSAMFGTVARGRPERGNSPTQGSLPRTPANDEAGTSKLRSAVIVPPFRGGTRAAGAG